LFLLKPSANFVIQLVFVAALMEEESVIFRTIQLDGKHVHKHVALMLPVEIVRHISVPNGSINGVEDISQSSGIEQLV